MSEEIAGLKDDPAAQREYLLARIALLRGDLSDRDKAAFDLSARAIANRFIRICDDSGASLHGMAGVVAAASALMLLEDIGRTEGGA